MAMRRTARRPPRTARVPRRLMALLQRMHSLIALLRTEFRSPLFRTVPTEMLRGGLRAARPLVALSLPAPGRPEGGLMQGPGKVVQWAKLRGPGRS